MEYTKGEWKTKIFDGSRLIYAEKDTGDELICRDVRHYNINLIAAAPDMYEALKAVKQWQNDPEMFIEEIAPMINRALAKAEGK